MQFDIITIFPEVFKPYFDTGMIRCAKEKKLAKINLHNLRDYTDDVRKTVDDRPYGGGPGMILKIEPIYKALQQIKKVKNQKIVVMDPAGKKFDQNMARKYSKLNNIVFLCGRYEGFDKRVEKFIDEKVSVGDYVLTGGELPAMTIIDAVTRLIPGVLNKEESLFEETHSKKGYIEYPQYTRPEIFKTKEGKELKVPKVLLSGDHGKIEEWKKKHSRIKSS
ncbi:MAG: tRNA (guanosine(37)-N1)-methyltransferase TrmD [Parcubacteria group bacterium]|nr:tRNA (guanosine(37)-N1)-methyltransferase TrmD [Parcubacteria group bacterium]